MKAQTGYRHRLVAPSKRVALLLANPLGKAIGIFEGMLRPDHVPTVEGDSNQNAGYSSFGRLYAIGYIRGLRQALYTAS